jgi:Ca2+-binding RTX toxin-like protein
MLGGAGDDTYFVDNVGDQVAEVAGEGFDTIAASVSYALGAGAEVELLTTGNIGGTAAINLTGNELGNEIWGNAGNNILNGGAGNDSLLGFDGNDTLVGGAGIDVMIGGTGDDTYFVTDAGDRVIEAAGEGSDTVAASVSYTLGAGAQVELLTTGDTAGTAAIDLTGNELDNAIWGNAGNNVLDGGAGNDTLLGFAGNDTFQFTTALNAATNVDFIAGFVSGQDRIVLDDAVFTGLTPGALSADAFVSGSAAADAGDRIIYDAATGALSFDPDGTGATLATQFALLPVGTTLTAADFMVI